MIEKGITGYDIIGDIHGHCDALELLLRKMGYAHNGTCFQHPDRKAIFVGDLIDRGPKIRETLSLVKAMADYGQALVTAGNHEYNAVCFCTKNEQGEWLREHSEKNQKQFQATVDAFADFPEEWADYLNWFKELPLFLDMIDFKVVHASWSQRHIDVIGSRTLSDESFLYVSSCKGTPEYWAVEIVLKGPEIELPEGVNVTDKEGHVRAKIRAKWWNQLEGATFSSLAFPDNDSLPDTAIAPPSSDQQWDVYDSDQTPVFVGHYWLPPQRPQLFGNVVCLDYSVAKGGFATAYQWEIDSKDLSQGCFVTSNIFSK